MNSNEDDCKISDTDLQELKRCLEQGDLCKATDAIRKSLEDIENTPLNIAVTGESGAGKSTFINAIRGLNDDDEGAAETGVVECTKDITFYTHPNFKMVKFWDLPGIGTPNFKPQNYLKKVEFRRYDFFIIMASERFRLNNADLAKEIQKMGKKFYFVRSKIDSDLHSNMKRKKKTYNEKNILEEIRNDCIKSLEESGIRKPQVFLLSCLELEKFDFNLMQETLEKELPSNKRHALLLSLPNISMPILERKREALKKEIWKLATLSCAVAAIPVPGLSIACDITILVTHMKHYRDTFGLDQDSLRKLASKFGKTYDELKSVIKSPLVLEEINSESVKALLDKTPIGAVVIVPFVSLIPLIGTIAAGSISFTTTYKMLQNVLEDIAEDAVRVLKKAFENAV